MRFDLEFCLGPTDSKKINFTRKIQFITRLIIVRLISVAKATKEVITRVFEHKTVQEGKHAQGPMPYVNHNTKPDMLNEVCVLYIPICMPCILTILVAPMWETLVVIEHVFR